MRLLDLDPHWITRDGRNVGIRFLCPHCRDCQVCVLFANPPDGGPAWPDDSRCPGNNKGQRWLVIGTSFTDLSLYPPIDGSETGHWHGHITDGAAT